MDTLSRNGVDRPRHLGPLWHGRSSIALTLVNAPLDSITVVHARVRVPTSTATRNILHNNGFLLASQQPRHNNLVTTPSTRPLDARQQSASITLRRANASVATSMATRNILNNIFLCWRHNNLVTTTSSQRPRRDHSMRVSSLSRSHFYAPTQAWRRRWRHFSVLASQQPRHNDHVTTTTSQLLRRLALLHMRTLRHTRACTVGYVQTPWPQPQRDQHILLASLRMHACLQQPTTMCSANGGMGGQGRNGACLRAVSRKAN